MQVSTRTTRLIHHTGRPLACFTFLVLVLGAVIDSTPLVIAGSVGYLGTMGLAMFGTHHRGVNARAGRNE